MLGQFRSSSASNLERAIRLQSKMPLHTPFARQSYSGQGGTALPTLQLGVKLTDYMTKILRPLEGLRADVFSNAVAFDRSQSV